MIPKSYTLPKAMFGAAAILTGVAVASGVPQTSEDMDTKSESK